MGKQPNDLDVFLVVATDYQVLLKIRVFREMFRMSFRPLSRISDQGLACLPK
jgi:hypothetical protein